VATYFGSEYSTLREVDDFGAAVINSSIFYFLILGARTKKGPSRPRKAWLTIGYVSGGMAGHVGGEST
jgi:hypothetical protein